MSGLKLVIRPMEHRDAEAVAMLSGELGYPATTARIERRVETIRRAALVQPADILVAYDTEARSVVGWVHVSMPALLSGDDVTEIWGLVVAATHRGRGVGRALMAASESWAVSHGCDEMRVRSSSHRTQAHAFYQQLGYQPAKKQLSFSRTLSPESARHPANDDAHQRNVASDSLAPVES